MGSEAAMPSQQRCLKKQRLLKWLVQEQKYEELLTNDLLHMSPHEVESSRTARDVVDVLLKGVHAPRLRRLTVLSPQIYNVLLQQESSICEQDSAPPCQSIAGKS